MKLEDRIKQFDLAWTLIKIKDFHEQGRATQILFKLLALRDENACGLIGRLIVLRYYEQHQKKEFIRSLFYSPIYDAWIQSRNMQSSLASRTLCEAFDCLFIAARSSSYLIEPLKKLAAFYRDEIDYDRRLETKLAAIERLETPTYHYQPALFKPVLEPPKQTESERNCRCVLV